jgi:hypothetical protein
MKTPILRTRAADGLVQEFVLQPGANSFGRYETNLHVLSHPSVSGRHCEVHWEGDSILARDLGSTNGTFVEGRRIGESPLHLGQTLRLGSVDLVLAVAGRPTQEPEPDGAVDMTPPVAPPIPSVRVAVPAVQPSEAPPPAFPTPKSFFRELPRVFVYPLSKNGVFLLLGGAILYALVGFYSRFSFVFLPLIMILTGLSTGYLFAYMQRIIASSAQGEDELPDWPDLSEWWSDIVWPLLLLLGTCLVCFGPAWALLSYGDRTDPRVIWGVWTLLAGGAFYFPMALLAVATTDNFFALNPVVVIPSIVRVIGPYLVACAVLAVLLVARFAVEWLAVLVRVPFVTALALSFASLYLLCIEMRILGLLFYCHRDRLGWFS